MGGIEHSALWVSVSDKATDEQRVFVRTLLAHAEPVLDRVVETAINAALSRVAALDPSIRPPRSAYATADDFVG